MATGLPRTLTGSVVTASQRFGILHQDQTEIGKGVPMIPLIEDYLDAINALCREFGVLRLELFGSAATGRFDPERSDLDFIVEYPPDYEFGPWLKRYFEFKERLEDLFNRPVDLVMVDAMRNPYFIQSVDESRRLLYAA